MTRMLSFVSALVVVVAFSTSAFSAERHRSLSCKPSTPDLPILMKNAEMKKPVDLENRADLKLVVLETQKRLMAMGVDCRISKVSEVFLQQEQLLLIAGYEIFAECEDAPTPAIAAYFDANKCFMAILDLAD